MIRIALGVSCSLLLLAGCRNDGMQADHPDASDAAGLPSDGALSDSGACVLDPAAPRSTWDPPRITVPWTFVPGPSGTLPAADAGAPGDGGTAAGCSGTLTYPSNVACRGTATVRMTGAGDIALVFADGSILAWGGDSVLPRIPYPPVKGHPTVWADYSRVDSIVCPVCGGFRTTLLEIRTAAAGQVLWVGREGVNVGDLSPELAQELFGVGVRQQLACQGNLGAGCYAYTRKVFDHVLETTPEQLVASFTYRPITTPNGDFGVLWGASAEQDVKFDPGCSDGPAVAGDTGFAIGRDIPFPSN